MARHKVTLKADLARGSCYWVAVVDAASEAEAVAAAEHLFMAEMDSGREWSFADFKVEKA